MKSNKNRLLASNDAVFYETTDSESENDDTGLVEVRRIQIFRQAIEVRLANISRKTKRRTYCSQATENERFKGPRIKRVILPNSSYGACDRVSLISRQEMGTQLISLNRLSGIN